MRLQKAPGDGFWPARRMTRRVEELDTDELRVIVDTLGIAVRTMASGDERLVLRVADVDWAAIQNLLVEDLSGAPDILRDALSLFRLTHAPGAARQPHEWWRELALALVTLHDAVAAELARRPL